MSRSKLLTLVLSRLLMAVLVFMLFFFLPAGTWNYWQAWMYMGVFFIPTLFVMMYLLKTDPALLERRMRTREERKEQRKIIRASYFVFILAYLIARLPPQPSDCQSDLR